MELLHFCATSYITPTLPKHCSPHTYSQSFVSSPHVCSQRFIVPSHTDSQRCPPPPTHSHPQRFVPAPNTLISLRPPPPHTHSQLSDPLHTHSALSYTHAHSALFPFTLIASPPSTNTLTALHSPHTRTQPFVPHTHSQRFVVQLGLADGVPQVRAEQLDVVLVCGSEVPLVHFVQRLWKREQKGCIS